MDVRPFKQEDLRQLRIQPAQAWCVPHLSDELLDDLERGANLEAYTVFHAGQPIAVLGLLEFWPGRAMAWSFISEAAGPHMHGLTRGVQQFLDLKGPRRVEAYVDEDFEAGHRWIELLGFTREALLRAFKPDGGAQVLYSRIKVMP